ncbi:hypothetical protein [Streptomyces sp. NBC_01304]|uniref:hypothetical protein n=1 Tax=Streptomyces sp. NBC_01304 TaxID=2903818 RepID=UPI002E14A4DB|nr:hypothetical protein OG430_03220 [Streptomyces sp. NBC_01304]
MVARLEHRCCGLAQQPCSGEDDQSHGAQLAYRELLVQDEEADSRSCGGAQREQHPEGARADAPQERHVQDVRSGRC